MPTPIERSRNDLKTLNQGAEHVPSSAVVLVYEDTSRFTTSPRSVETSEIADDWVTVDKYTNTTISNASVERSRNNSETHNQGAEHAPYNAAAENARRFITPPRPVAASDISADWTEVEETLDVEKSVELLDDHLCFYFDSKGRKKIYDWTDSELGQASESGSDLGQASESGSDLGQASESGSDLGQASELKALWTFTF